MEPAEKPVLLPGGDGRASAEQLKELEKYVFSMVASLMDQTAGGDITSDPYFLDNNDNACKYCPYQKICRDRPEKRWLRKVKTVDEFWEKVEERNTNG